LTKLITLTLFAYALVGLDAATVLCFGRDGHVAVEAAVAHHQVIGAGIADANGVDGGASAVTKARAMPDHGPCVDVAVIPNVDLTIGGGDTRDGYGGSGLCLPPIVMLADNAEALVDIAPGTRSGPVAVHRPSPVIALRTTVLRI
jgi:hypothetical protein